MPRKHALYFVLWLVVFSLAFLNTASASTSNLRPAMRDVVICVYNFVRSKPGVFGVSVYDIAGRKYDVEYNFRLKGQIFTGRIGIDGEIGPFWHFATNDTPAGQPDEVEWNFLGKGAEHDLSEACRLKFGLDDTFTVKGAPPDPPPKKIDMSPPPTESQKNPKH